MEKITDAFVTGLVIVVTAVLTFVVARGPLVSEIDAMKVDLEHYKTELSSVSNALTASFYDGVLSACVVFVGLYNDQDSSDRQIDVNPVCNNFVDAARQQRWYSIAQGAK